MLLEAAADVFGVYQGGLGLLSMAAGTYLLFLIPMLIFFLSFLSLRDFFANG